MQLVLLASERTLLSVVVPAREARTLTALSLYLAEAPCGPIGMRSPDDLTGELLAQAQAVQ